MDRNEQEAIERLFEKLATVERQSSPRDAQAEALIRHLMAAQPGAAYYMAQVVIMQEQALQTARARVEELESQAATGRHQAGGMFGNLFGRNDPDRGNPSSAQQGGGRLNENRSGPSFSETPQQQQPGGSGFLASAAQAAMGVAGGVLLANAVGGFFGEDKAKAAKPAADEDDDEIGGLNDFF